MLVCGFFKLLFNWFYCNKKGRHICDILVMFLGETEGFEANVFIAKLVMKFIGATTQIVDAYPIATRLNKLLVHQAIVLAHLMLDLFNTDLVGYCNDHPVLWFFTQAFDSLCYSLSCGFFTIQFACLS